MNLVAIYNKQLISVADPDPIVPDPNKKLITRNRNGLTIPERTENWYKKVLKSQFMRSQRLIQIFLFKKNPFFVGFVQAYFTNLIG